jgi:hypothetical protein
MSDTVVLEAQVKGITNLKDLKASIKEAKDELLKFEVGTEGFERAQKKVSLLKDKMDGLGDSMQIQGSGAERLTQSFGLLTQSLGSGDLEKAKVAFTGIGQAMSAIPIFLIIEGLKLLWDNLDKVIAAFSDSAKEAAALNKELEYTNTLIETNAAMSDRQIRLLKAGGASRQEIFEATQAGIDAENSAIKEQTKLYEDLFTTQKEGSAESLQTLDKINQLNIKYYRNTTTLAENILLNEKAIEDERKKAREEAEQWAKDHPPINKTKIEDLELIKNFNIEKVKIDEEYSLKSQSISAKESKFKQSLLDLELKKAKEQEKAKSDAKKIGFDAAQSLSQSFFQFQLNAAKGNAKEELKIRKQMFQVDKAFNVARATQDGIRAVQAALTIPPPGGQLLAIANAALAAANVAKIASSNFDGGGSTVDSNISTPNISSPSSVPTINTRSQGSTLLDDNGNPITQQQHDQQLIRAYILEKELTNKQKNAKRIEEQSRF